MGGQVPGDLVGIELVAAEPAFQGGQLNGFGAGGADFFGAGGGGGWRGAWGRGDSGGLGAFGDILAQAVEFGELMAADGAALGIEREGQEPEAAGHQNADDGAHPEAAGEPGFFWQTGHQAVIMSGFLRFMGQNQIEDGGQFTVIREAFFVEPELIYKGYKGSLQIQRQGEAAAVDKIPGQDNGPGQGLGVQGRGPGFI